MPDTLWRCWTVLRATVGHAHHRAAAVAHHAHHVGVGKAVRHAIRHQAHVGHREAHAVWNAIRVCLGLGALLLGVPPVVRLVVPSPRPAVVAQGPVSVPEPAGWVVLVVAVGLLAVVR